MNSPILTNQQLLLNALKEARELVEHWGAYASAHFQEKWDLAGDLKKLDDVIGAGEKCMEPAVEPTAQCDHDWVGDEAEDHEWCTKCGATRPITVNRTPST